MAAWLDDSVSIPGRDHPTIWLDRIADSPGSEKLHALISGCGCKV
jgi:hypothetical protein